MPSEVSVFAPATVSNVACGFDIMGFAVNEPGDVATVRKIERLGVFIKNISGDDRRLPREPYKNTAGIAVIELLKRIDVSDGIEIELQKNMPLGSGLGSSAASAVAAVLAANILFDNQLSRIELLPFVLEAEKAACGTAHADNAAPSMLGGFILVRSYNPLDTISLAVPDELICTILHPALEIQTEHARKILSEKVFLKDAVTQWGNVGGLVTGLLTKDYELIGRSLQDVIVEPVRSKLIPGFTDIKKAAIGAGALGCSISGSGPAIFALSKSRDTANNVGQSMKDTCDAKGIDNTIYVSEVNIEGARVISQDE
ncbi:MAG: homoserine kinase [Ignavibacteria bacterium]|nr:homoserine kinase [Ignavibacteria bacterium]